MESNNKKVRKGWQLADLSQLVRTNRARNETVEKHLPTLTTNCGHFYGKDSHGLSLNIKPIKSGSPHKQKTQKS